MKCVCSPLMQQFGYCLCKPFPPKSGNSLTFKL